MKQCFQNPTSQLYIPKKLLNFCHFCGDNSCVAAYSFVAKKEEITHKKPEFEIRWFESYYFDWIGHLLLWISASCRKWEWMIWEPYHIGYERVNSGNVWESFPPSINLIEKPDLPCPSAQNLGREQIKFNIITEKRHSFIPINGSPQNLLWEATQCKRL